MSSETPQSPKKEAVTPEDILASPFTGASVPAPDGASVPIDLSAIPRRRWEEYVAWPVVLPPDLDRYIAGIEGEPTVLEKDHIEERVISFYGIQPPYTALFMNGRVHLIRE